LDRCFAAGQEAVKVQEKVNLATASFMADYQTWEGIALELAEKGALLTPQPSQNFK
jgi:hypothetical protein